MDRFILFVLSFLLSVTLSTEVDGIANNGLVLDLQTRHGIARGLSRNGSLAVSGSVKDLG
jgi:hypothetical protein